MSLSLLASLAAVTLSCASPSSAPFVAGPLALGNWGGDSAAMIVGDTAMHLHVGCTYGDVSGRIDVGPNGQFAVAGSYMLRAFPIAVGPSVPARFSGQVNAAKGGTATITVTVDDTVTHQMVVRGPVTVSLGQTPRLMPCPICRRPIVTRRR
jgi:hypothetical protein